MVRFEIPLTLGASEAQISWNSQETLLSRITGFMGASGMSTANRIVNWGHRELNKMKLMPEEDREGETRPRKHIF